MKMSIIDRFCGIVPMNLILNTLRKTYISDVMKIEDSFQITIR